MLTPISERAYARPELLAETGWLADRMADPRIRVVDARSEKEYGAGHIAGAVHMDGFGNLPRAGNGDMGSPAEFARLAGGLGIDSDTTVIVYDTPSQRMGMEAVYCSLEQAKAGVGRDDVVFWDTRSGDEYAGNATAGFGSVPRPGRIPGLPIWSGLSCSTRTAGR